MGCLSAAHCLQADLMAVSCVDVVGYAQQLAVTVSAQAVSRVFVLFAVGVADLSVASEPRF